METDLDPVKGGVMMGHEDIDWQSLDKSKFYLWSFGFFMGVRTLVYPPILIKTRLQVQQGSAQYKGTFDAFCKIFKAEGLRGYYKGFLTTSVGIIPAYEFIRHRIKAYLPESMRYEALRNFIGGGAASLASSLVSVPLDVVAQLLMIQDGTVNRKKYSGGLNAFTDILKTKGIRGLYRGYTASIMVFVPSSGIWWGTYATVKGKAAAFIHEQGGFLRQIDVLIYGLCGILAGSTAVVFTNPMDVVKTRLQVLTYTNPRSIGATSTSNSRQTTASDSRVAPTTPLHESSSASTGNKHTTGISIWSTARQLLREEGWRALKKGITARMLSMAPVSFLMTITYEQAKRLSLKRE